MCASASFTVHGARLSGRGTGRFQSAGRSRRTTRSRWTNSRRVRATTVRLVWRTPQRQSCLDASFAPSAIDLNLAQAISGSTTLTVRANVAMPQSVPASTRSRPTISA